MTVKELIEKLNTLPPDQLVIVSKDGEGNEHSPLSEISTGFYAPDSTWSGEFTSRAQDAADLGATQEVVCLWPTN